MERKVDSPTQAGGVGAIRWTRKGALALVFASIFALPQFWLWGSRRTAMRASCESLAHPGIPG